MVMDNTQHPQFTIGNLHLYGLNKINAEQLGNFYKRNQDFFNQYLINKKKSSLDNSFCQKVIDDYEKNYRNDKALAFAIVHDNRVIGLIHLGFINRGALNSSFLRFEIDFEHQNRGIMTKSLEKIIDYAFESKGLTRIYANFHPLHDKSRRLLDRLGFSNRVSANDYLDENYIQTSLTHKTWNSYKKIHA
jgi:ribosomal-protein-alanine N-acetyltransferase